MNLRMFNGKVPVWEGGNSPCLLVDFPSKQEFDKLYARTHREDSLDKYWAILNSRIKGASLTEIGHQYGITKERVRQIEARFIRLMRESYLKSKTS
jgi:DNA-directed RNA polymerase sigma subunit (sigma70/sigma32)